MQNDEIKNRIEDIVTEILQNIIIYSKKYLRDEDIISLRNEIEDAVRILDEAHKGQLRKSGELYIFHPLHVTLDVSRNHMVDRVSIFSSLFHDVLEDTGLSREFIGKTFGQDVLNVVDGLTKIKDRKKESFDKFFNRAIKYPRILYIKIFDRFHNIKTLEFLEKPKQKRIATETLDIYVKICDRLSLSDIADEMHFFCCKILKPERVAAYSSRLKTVKKAHRDTLDKIEKKMREMNRSNSLNIVSIEESWSLFLDLPDYEQLQLSDVFRLNFVVKTRQDTYRLLGVLNELFFHVRGSINDYIAVPKYNNYRSIDFEIFHNGIKVRISITTQEFNVFNHKGILTYGFSENSAKNMEYMKHLESYLREEADFRNIEQIFAYHNPEEITVISRDGKPFNLEIGSTALDFAFKIHSEVGLKTLYAIVDGNKVPVETKLQDGDYVEIVTSDEYTVSSDLFDKCTSLRAKRIISSFISRGERDAALSFAAKYMENRLARYQITYSDFSNAFAQAYPEYKRQSFLLKILSDNSRADDILLELNLIAPEKMKSIKDMEKTFLSRIGAWFSSTGKPSIIEADFLKSHACPLCVPIMKDTISGFFQDFRLVVHRDSCERIKKMPREQIFALRWRPADNEKRAITLEIRSIDASGISNKVTGAFRKKQVNIAEIIGKKVEDSAVFLVKLESLPIQKISELLETLRSIPEIQEISF